MASRNREILEQITEHVVLCRDPKTGIAWIEDGTCGLGYSCHSSIDATGSILGMKAQGYWGKKDRTVRSHGYIYNIDSLVTRHEYDDLARKHCQCGGIHA